ncbi:CheR family methyltransferase [Derxia gummosa]|uniref:protein-glutamate O-methyltransferase n=1 Tax=Derxia gummosa DSM 723 TaxID=1121388 RepID=A0A8B6XBJ4_9BURK|nr:protein-glutamate O-methyltransferase CheR [Derxia gummosa]
MPNSAVADAVADGAGPARADRRAGPRPPAPAKEPGPSGLTATRAAGTTGAGYLNGGPRLPLPLFRQLRELFERESGVHLKDVKLPLVEGRLARHLARLGADGWDDYLARVRADTSERQHFIDLLTTNETHFFREPAHFELLRDTILPSLPPGRRPNLWCAASSTGEEPYTLAMVLAEALGPTGYDLLASDISTRVLEVARAGRYPVEDAADIPAPLRRRWCLRGTGSQEGRFALSPVLHQRLRFEQINLCTPLPAIGPFDVVFLRNVMIYFPPATKRRVVESVTRTLRPGGWLITSHSESLHGFSDELKTWRPSVYRKPE